MSVGDPSSFQSFFCTRDYEKEHAALYSTAADTHPLASVHRDGVGGTACLKGGATVGDPLTRLMEGSDPLSMMAVAEALDAAEEPPQETQTSRDMAAHDDWSSRRRAILAQFTTSQLVTVTTRSGDIGADTVSVRTASRAQARLAQLQAASDDDAVRDDLTQHEVIAHINRMKKQLQEAWQAEQRVRALKLVIQACKMLEDASVPQFYPSMFVLVTDILDLFGTLVYNRVTAKDREGGATVLPPGGGLASDSGRETCRNWFYKIASIRELLARLYVEMAVLRCYDLLEPGGAEAAARRLVGAVRGVGSPLVAGYARCYLSRVAPAAARPDNLQDFITVLTHRPSQTSSALKMEPLSLESVPPLGPALEWCMRAAVCACAADQRDSWLEELLERKAVHSSSLILMALLQSAGPQFLSSRAVQCVQAVASCDAAGYRRCDLLSTLGAQLAAGEVPGPDRLHVLNAAWRLIQELSSAGEYMQCAPDWAGYVAKYFGARQLAVLLRDVVDHVTPGRSFEHHYRQLERLLTLAVADGAQLRQLAGLPSFSALLELLQEDEVRQRASRRLLQLLIGSELELAAEPALVELGMTCCQTLHDSVSMVSLDDERRETADIVCRFLRRAVDLTPAQLESSLDLLVQARGAFFNLEPVTVQLVQAVHALAVAGRRSGRQRAFCAACVAFCFITLPALDDVLLRARLYALTAQVALCCRCLGQADACIRACISSLPEIPSEVGPAERCRPALAATLELIRSVLSALLVFPDQPSQSPLYLVRGLLTAVDRIAWLQETEAVAGLMVDFLRLLSALSQPRYLYSVPGVDSNDTLYGGDHQLMAEISSLTDDVVNRATSHLKQAGQAPSRSQAALAAELCLCLLRTGNLQHPRVSSLCMQLYQLCGRSEALPPQLRAALRETLKSSSSKPGGTEILQRLKMSR